MAIFEILLRYLNSWLEVPLPQNGWGREIFYQVFLKEVPTGKLDMLTCRYCEFPDQVNFVEAQLCSEVSYRIM